MKRAWRSSSRRQFSYSSQIWSFNQRATNIPIVYTVQVVEQSSLSNIPGLSRLSDEIAETAVFIGYPKYLDSFGATEHAFEVGPNYALNVILAIRSQNERYLSSLGRVHLTTEDKWPLTPAEVRWRLQNIFFYRRKFFFILFCLLFFLLALLLEINHENRIRHACQ